ncbi:hypothetical protein K457DRAFT_736106 [Linnemannia elongata AG-77]|uniref:Uncharacterized protein n=1 Tax=Linnemannia elongata AG-77 TaxID=1314771 RepID=A0A197JLR9_9FUNG|nr:hypothetical protein K457DRAFT_736106 [Linnemannia elongata AG-77]
MEHSPGQGLNSSLQNNSNADIVISVDQTAPEQHATSSPANVSPQIGDDSSVDPQEPALTIPARNNSESTQGNGSSQHSGYEEAPRSLSPPHLPVGASFRGDPISAFRYRGLMACESRLPSIRSEPLPRQQHSPLPYTSSLGNEDHPLGGHHLHRDAGRPMVIDYAGLDASVAEATLVENGFQRPTFVEADAARDSKERAPEGGRRAPSVDLAASTGSSCLLGPPSSNSGKSEFQRRSARKTSFYSEQAPRVRDRCL